MHRPTLVASPPDPPAPLAGHPMTRTKPPYEASTGGKATHQPFRVVPAQQSKHGHPLKRT